MCNTCLHACRHHFFQSGPIRTFVQSPTKCSWVWFRFPLQGCSGTVTSRVGTGGPRCHKCHLKSVASLGYVQKWCCEGPIQNYGKDCSRVEQSLWRKGKRDPIHNSQVHASRLSLRWKSFYWMAWAQLLSHVSRTSLKAGTREVSKQIAGRKREDAQFSGSPYYVPVLGRA